MIYQYFFPINTIFTLFGIKKIFIASSGRSCKITVWNKLWSLIIIIAFLTSFSVSLSSAVNLTKKNNLEYISRINYVAISVLIIFLNLFFGDTVCFQLYTTVENILCDLKFSKSCLKIISVKILLWLFVPATIYTVFIILEIVYLDPPFYILLTGMPIYLTVVHLLLHLYLLVAILKSMNIIMSKMLSFHQTRNVYIEEKHKKLEIFKYLINPDINFIKIIEDYHFDLKLLCRLYDDLCTCIQLLEKHHGFQVSLLVNTVPLS